MADVCPTDPAVPCAGAQPSPQALSDATAHDFNNILGAMMGWIHLARRRTTDPHTDALLERALAAGERGKRLTLRLLARPGSDDAALDRTAPRSDGPP